MRTKRHTVHIQRHKLFGRGYAVCVLRFAFCVFLLLPAPALADAPGTRGDDPGPQGGLSQPPAAPSGAIGVPGVSWRDVTPLPPLQSRAAQTDTLSWLSRSLNPGVWMLNSTMGASAAHVQTFAELMQQIVTTLVPGGNLVPTKCSDDNLVVCTPANLTYAHPNMGMVWGVLKPVALALVTLLFVWRMLGLISEGPASLAGEGKSLAGTFFVTMLFITQAQWALGMLIDLFNAISGALLAGAGEVLTPVSASVNSADLGLGAALTALVFWLAMLALTVKSFFRVVSITVLVGMAPLAGALLMHKATAARFQSWLNKLIDLLVEQVALALMLILAAAMIEPLKAAAGSGPWNGYSGQIFGLMTLIMAVTGQTAALGFVHAIPASYLEARVKMKALGLAGKALSPLKKPALAGAAAVGAAGLGAAALGAAVPVAAAAGLGAGGIAASAVGAAAVAPRASAVARRIKGAHTAFTEAQTVARQEQAQAAVLDARRGSYAIGLPRHEVRQRAANRNRAQRGDLAGIAPASGRYGMRLPDGTYKVNGAGATRRNAYHAGMATAGGMLARERVDLTRRVQADETRLNRVRARMAREEVAGGPPDARAHERASVLEQRIQTNRARMAAIDPTTERGRAEQRNVALGLADQALPPDDRRNRPADAMALHAARRGAARAIQPRPPMQQARMTVDRVIRRRPDLAERVAKSAAIPRRERRLSPTVAGSLRRADTLPPVAQPRKSQRRNTERPPRPEPSVAPHSTPPPSPLTDEREAYRRQVKATVRRIRGDDVTEEPA